MDLCDSQKKIPAAAMATVGEVATIEPQLPQLDVVHGPKECKECKELQTAEALLRSEEEPEKVAVVEVEIGSSQSKATPRQISTLCNKAYGYRRLSESEARSRLAMGDGGSNRVLHVAYRNGELVGCCSSTLQPPWTPRSCGHWGLLSVHPDAQGTGVASALIAAAKRRLLDAGCRSIQIEYEFTASDPDSERLLQWYEGKCGFKSRSPREGSEG